MDWDNFYERLGGGQFFDALRTDMKRHYDYVLIDSRTGLSDIADICTVQMPDVLGGLLHAQLRRASKGQLRSPGT